MHIWRKERISAISELSCAKWEFFYLDCQSPELYKTSVNCLMYADDLLLMSETETGLQRIFDRLEEYCDKWDMEVNTDKTKIMKFSGNGHRCKTVFRYKSYSVENVFKYKYLGTEFSSSGSWINAISNLSDRAMKVYEGTIPIEEIHL